jgi:Domain of unknown function (DUF4261)
MPTKGLFTQGVCLLLGARTSIDEVTRALSDGGFPILKEVDGSEEWAFSGPSVVVGYLPKVNGLVSIDIVNRAWPDAMGDPKSEPMLFAAWGMGQFGPFTYPGGLSRACAHSYTWPEAKMVAGAHKAFLRLRMSYIFGLSKDAPVLPKDYDPLAEMGFLSLLTLAAFDVPGVTGYFNPNGEVLSDETGFRDVWDTCKEQGWLPLPLWTNARLYNLNEKFSFMDTVGNGQLDVADVEAVYPTSDYDPNDVANYLRNVTQYLIDCDREIRTGEAFDGPGESNLSWMVECLDDGLITPPRRVLRLYPKSAQQEIKTAVAAATSRST